MHRFVALLALALAAACDRHSDGMWQGYIEGEYVLLASPYAGQLERLYVHRGDEVQAAASLFALEHEAERAARVEAEQRLRSAQARLENLTVPRRPTEIQALRAEVMQAKAALELSATQLAQHEKLFKAGFIAQARLDEARTTHERDAARLAEAEAQLKNALQPLGRDAERKAAQAEVEAAKAALAQAQWRLEQKRVSAPVSGRVHETYFVQGEWVPAGRPVVALLPPGNIKARFYVPETALGSLEPGRALEVLCDGCPAPVAAKVSFVSTQAEYTPPVLYSRDSRAKLVFLVEARLEEAKLRPGQPVDVRLK